MVLKNRTCLGWVSITVLVGQFHRNIQTEAEVLIVDEKLRNKYPINGMKIQLFPKWKQLLELVKILYCFLSPHYLTFVK
jgi:hypothetical protein